MSYFSRLTDIVTCNLSEILDDAADPVAALADVIGEMEEGLAGCERCVKRAERAAEDLAGELQDYARQINEWMDKAKAALGSGDEEYARRALLRKKEVEDLLAGLEREHTAAVATCDSLRTTLRALEARLAEARRRHRELETGQDQPSPGHESDVSTIELAIEASRSQTVEDELEELRRQLEAG